MPHRYLDPQVRPPIIDDAAEHAQRDQRGREPEAPDLGSDPHQAVDPRRVTASRVQGPKKVHVQALPHGPEQGNRDQAEPRKKPDQRAVRDEPAGGDGPRRPKDVRVNEILVVLVVRYEVPLRIRGPVLCVSQEVFAVEPVPLIAGFPVVVITGAGGAFGRVVQDVPVLGLGAVAAP